MTAVCRRTDQEMTVAGNRQSRRDWQLPLGMDKQEDLNDYYWGQIAKKSILVKGQPWSSVGIQEYSRKWLPIVLGSIQEYKRLLLPSGEVAFVVEWSIIEEDKFLCSTYYFITFKRPRHCQRNLTSSDKKQHLVFLISFCDEEDSRRGDGLVFIDNIPILDIGMNAEVSPVNHSCVCAGIFPDNCSGRIHPAKVLSARNTLVDSDTQSMVQRTEPFLIHPPANVRGLDHGQRNVSNAGYGQPNGTESLDCWQGCPSVGKNRIPNTDRVVRVEDSEHQQGCPSDG